ncbi:NAD+ synthase [Salinisphaera japonica]|uniref:Glutamine-dependent NAD(+) synthetase n=1 Tax=Salinisphaera japonica YTM-1 TaxID=1209778 RepID=A0A423PR63_9GAMM|nr:NAD+ synthase [Salinisphaera japonica]ROO28048.1 NAD synthetase [Salinisphaera japonica YTM-1]
MADHSLRIAMAQLNVWVGDIAGNTRQIIEAAHTARDRDRADIVVVPELALIGYPPDDLLLRRGLPDAIAAALDELQAGITGITAVVGYPEYAGEAIYNAARVIRDGQAIAHYRKQCLPNYGVFDERRHYRPGDAPCVFEQAGHAIGVTICEDIWETGPAAQARAAGAEMLVNLNASPFHADKQPERERLLAGRATDNDVAICYVNCVGGQDELVFDGQSFAVARDGTVAARAPAFEAGVFTVEMTGTRSSGDIAERPAPEALVYDALVRATRDYVDRNGFPGALIGLSGGIDSALALAIAVDALGGDRVWAVSLPSRYTADISNTDAADQAERMGVRYDEMPIEDGFSSLLNTLAPLFGDRAPDTAEENLQSRIRGALLMSLSNKFGHVVLATGNKSEMAVGYATLYGDMCGGFAPLKDVYKTWVYRLSNFRNTRGAVIPERVITRPPSAELRDDQADTDTLPEYDVLDPIIEAWVEEGASIDDIVARGFVEADVRQAAGLIRRNEYKRRQAAPGPKITHRAFGRDRRYPITAVYGDL